MKSKAFYSMAQVDRITGVRKKDGYEIEIEGEKFYTYEIRSIRNRKVYILDPQNGIAILGYNCTGDDEYRLSKIELIEKAIEVLIKEGILKKWREVRERQSYKLSIQMFEAYKRAESLRKKQKQAECYENRELGRQQDI